MTLPASIQEQVEREMHARGGVSRIEQLPLQRLVADHAEKFLVFGHDSEPTAMVVVSSSRRPGSVREAARRAEAARLRLGPELGSAVLTPYFVGDADGASYSITQFLRPISPRKYLGRWQRWRVRGDVFDWLHQVNRHTVAAASSSEIEQTFVQPLRAIASHPMLDMHNRSAAEQALQDIQSGQWVPRTVLTHYDFWHGNLLHSSPDRPGLRFVIIDWEGSALRGPAVYDLVRMSMSLGVSRAAFERQLKHHCAAVGCEASQAMHYLMSAFGYLSMNLGDWPAEKFAQSAASCASYLRRR